MPAACGDAHWRATRDPAPGQEPHGPHADRKLRHLALASGRRRGGGASTETRSSQNATRGASGAQAQLHPGARDSAPCHVRRRTAQGARISRPIRSRRAGPWPAAAPPGVGKAWEKSPVTSPERESSPRPANQRLGNAACERARARCGPIPGEDGRASGSFRAPRPRLEWVSSPRAERVGLSAPRPIRRRGGARARGGWRARRGGGVGASPAQDL